MDNMKQNAAFFIEVGERCKNGTQFKGMEFFQYKLKKMIEFGERFESKFCARCVHDEAFREAWADDSIPDVEGCEIIARAQRGDQPPEWIEDENGPLCTAFELLDGETPPDDLTDDMFGEK